MLSSRSPRWAGLAANSGNDVLCDSRRSNAGVFRRPLGTVTRRVLRCLSMALTMLVSIGALGADPAIEKQVQALQKKALEEDNLNVNYPEAIRKLATAINKCDGEKCSATLKGALYRDLGAMLILNGSLEDGRAAFNRALGLDSSLDLDASYKSQAIEVPWNEAKASAGLAVGTGGVHVAASAGLVRTPFPVYAEFSDKENLRVVVKYRSSGVAEWKTLQLRKIGTGYGGLIPCQDVAEGGVQYYIQGYGASDVPVAVLGSSVKPYTVPIKSELSGPIPGLPGQPPPKQCPQPYRANDCPPDFPGCRTLKKKVAGGACSRNRDCVSGSCVGEKCVDRLREGQDCEQDDECASGSCSDGQCAAATKGADEACDGDGQCSSGACKDGRCVEGGAKDRSNASRSPRMWFGVGGSWDIVALPGGENVCALGSEGAPVNTVG